MMRTRALCMLVLLMGAVALTSASHAQEDELSRPKLYAEVLAPLVKAAEAARQERFQTDPDFANAVNQDLNANRLNIALLGYGEEHGQPYEQFGISVTILSLNLAADD